MTPTSRIKAEARAEAQKTLDAVWVNEGYPVDPVAIARRLGVEVYTSDLPDNVSGMLRKAAGAGATIYLDTDEVWKRQRFTCAHEVGHYVRHADETDGELGFVDYRGPSSSRGDDVDEVFANEFAAALLLPEDRVRALFKMGDR